MKHYLAALLFILLPSIGFAQQQFDVSAKSRGDVTRWHVHNGKTSVTYKGRSGGYYVFKFRRDGSKGAPLRGTWWTTRKGEAVQAKFNGITTRFSPHDCTLTVGRCVYREQTAGKRSQTMIRNATVTNGIWNYTLHTKKETPANLVEKGTFSVDRFGYIIDRTYSQKINGVWHSGWTQRINYD